MSLTVILEPAWLPPTLALVCAVVSGLSSFGDAILFHILWALCVAVGLAPGEGGPVLMRVVLYVGTMMLAALPQSIWLARTRLWPCAPFAAALAVTGAPASALGAWLLLHVEAGSLKIAFGGIFLVVSTVQLTGAAIAAVRRRARIGSVNGSAAAAIQLRDEDGQAGNSSRPTLEDARQPSDTIPAALEPPPPEAASGCHLTPLSPVYSSRVALIGLACAGAAAGLLGGMFGTNGPPLMLAYVLLAFHKDDIRGTTVGFSCVEAVVRVSAFAVAASSGSVPDAEAAGGAGVFIAIVVATWLGFAVGNWLRGFANTAAIARILLGLVLCAAATMLGAFASPANFAGFAVAGCVWLAAIGLALRFPGPTVAVWDYIAVRCFSFSLPCRGPMRPPGIGVDSEKAAADTPPQSHPQLPLKHQTGAAAQPQSQEPALESFPALTAPSPPPPL